MAPHILVVDDDPLILQLIPECFRIAGEATCTTVDTVAAALRLIDQEHFDAVITDVVMPDGDGIALTRELVARHPALPVIVITGYADYTYIEALEAGAYDFLHKPFDCEELVARFSRVMRDCRILREIRHKNLELERIGNEMVASLQQEAVERCQELREEIEALRQKLTRPDRQKP